MAYAPPRTEVLVVDDGSKDAIISKTAERFPGAGAIRLPKQNGFCRAVNAGIAATSAPVLELLNDDTIVHPGWAKSALPHFQDPNIAAVAPLVLQMAQGGEPLIDSAGDCYFLGGVAGKRFHGLPLREVALQREKVFGVSGSSGFYRRAALEQVKRLPEEFGAYFEDVDLSFRLRWHGYECLFEPGSRVSHHVSGSYGAILDEEAMTRHSQNEERAWLRNIPQSALWTALPLHALVLLGKAVRRFKEGKLRAWLKGKWLALKEHRAIRSHRRSLQKGRSKEAAELRKWI